MSTAINTLLEDSPDVCGGRLHIKGTHITVNQIARLSQQGYNADEIANQYAELTMAQVYAALAYYHANQEEVETDLKAEANEINNQAEALKGAQNKEMWLAAFNELQRSLKLTPAKAAEWQNAIREARR
jgi:uncharacterized protein (DUF433 family)